MSKDQAGASATNIWPGQSGKTGWRPLLIGTGAVKQLLGHQIDRNLQVRLVLRRSKSLR